jgi:hypothetical protein
MSRTTTTVDVLEGMENVATPYMEHNEERVAIPYLDVDAAGAAAGLNSSVSDMTRWLRLQLANGQFEGQQVVPAEVIAETRRPRTLINLPPDIGELYPTLHFIAYGLGWGLSDHHGRLMVTHGGGLPGMFSRTVLVPEEGLGIVVLTNSESAAPRVVAMHIVDAFFGVDGPDWNQAYLDRQAEHEAEEEAEDEESETPEAPTEAAPPLPAAQYAGRYHNAVLGPAVVEQREGELSLTVPEHGGLACELERHDNELYRCAWTNIMLAESEVRFTIEDGRPQQLAFSVRPEFIDPVEYVFARPTAPLTGAGDRPR